MTICDLKALRNEADVEQSFVRPLLKLLGYSDTAIIPKASLDALDVRGMRGQKQAKYRPDFALQVEDRLRFLIEAKAPSENLDERMAAARIRHSSKRNAEGQDHRPILAHKGAPQNALPIDLRCSSY